MRAPLQGLGPPGDRYAMWDAAYVLGSLSSADRREFEAKVLRSDERTDLAVLKIDPKGERLPVLELGDSDALQVGSNRVVFRVVARTAPPESELAGQQDQIAEEVLERKRNLAWEIYEQNLKQQLQASGTLKMNESAMKKFLATYQKS